MINNHVREQSGRILRLNWFLTGDQSRPLVSCWSIDLPGEMPVIRTPGLSEVCNVAVIEKCETSVTPERRANRIRALIMCGQ